MNILITSVGRRSYIVKAFKKAIGPKGLVHVGNSTDESVAFRYADKCVITPLIDNDNYVRFLLDYCKDNHITLLISLFDMDLLVLARNKVFFERAGVRLAVSSQQVVNVCNDKWETYLFLKKHSFLVPKTYLDLGELKNDLAIGAISYPLVVKPRFGCGSIAVSVAYNEKDLNFYAQKVEQQLMETYLARESSRIKEKIIYQELLRGQEYGADIINDLNGNFVSVIVKRKLAMRAGETDAAEIVDVPCMRKDLERLAGLTRHLANMDCDLFLVDGRPYILEMNARFGGGYPFSHMAGCDLPLAITKWARGETVDSKILEAKKGFRGFKEMEVVEWVVPRRVN